MNKKLIWGYGISIAILYCGIIIIGIIYHQKVTAFQKSVDEFHKNVDIYQKQIEEIVGNTILINKQIEEIQNKVGVAADLLEDEAIDEVKTKLIKKKDEFKKDNQDKPKDVKTLIDIKNKYIKQ